MPSKGPVAGVAAQRPVAVLFDLDGTLLDTYACIEQCFHTAMRQVFGHDEPFDRFASTIGRPLAYQLGLYAHDEAELEALLDAYRSANHALNNTGDAFPGVPDALQAIASADVRMGVVTSKIAPSAKKALGRAGVGSCFDCVVGAGDTEHAKPAPDPLLLGARLLDVPRNRCVYVGDSPFDMQAAHAAGMRVVAVAWGQHPLDSLLAASPDAVAHDARQMTASVLSLLGRA